MSLVPGLPLRLLLLQLEAGEPRHPPCTHGCLAGLPSGSGPLGGTGEARGKGCFHTAGARQRSLVLRRCALKPLEGGRRAHLASGPASGGSALLSQGPPASH